jgi:hypothetical protein
MLGGWGREDCVQGAGGGGVGGLTRLVLFTACDPCVEGHDFHIHTHTHTPTPPSCFPANPCLFQPRFFCHPRTRPEAPRILVCVGSLNGAPIVAHDKLTVQVVHDKETRGAAGGNEGWGGGGDLPRGWGSDARGGDIGVCVYEHCAPSTLLPALLPTVPSVKAPVHAPALKHGRVHGTVMTASEGIGQRIHHTQAHMHIQTCMKQRGP